MAHDPQHPAAPAAAGESLLRTASIGVRIENQDGIAQKTRWAESVEAAEQRDFDEMARVIAESRRRMRVHMWLRVVECAALVVTLGVLAWRAL